MALSTIRQYSIAPRLALLLLASVASGCATLPSATTHANAPNADCVVLLHGLGRTQASMHKMGQSLAEAGYNIANVGYPSRRYTIQELAPSAVGLGLESCRAMAAVNIHFVTHSMGGILVREYLADNRPRNLGRVVMLAPPNHGSESVDAFRHWPGFDFFFGKPAAQLSTAEDSVPLSLGPADFELGIIAGTRTFSPLFSTLLPNPDDGKVSVASTKLEGMQDFRVVERSHAFIMRSDDVIDQVIAFLHNGEFSDAPEAPSAETQLD